MPNKPVSLENRINIDLSREPELRKKLEDFRYKNGRISETAAIKLLVLAALRARGLGIS